MKACKPSEKRSQFYWTETLTLIANKWFDGFNQVKMEMEDLDFILKPLPIWKTLIVALRFCQNSVLRLCRQNSVGSIFLAARLKVGDLVELLPAFHLLKVLSTRCRGCSCWKKWLGRNMFQLERHGNRSISKGTGLKFVILLGVVSLFADMT